MISAFDDVVQDMMAVYGTEATLVVSSAESYDPETSENTVNVRKIPVKVIFFDYLDKRAGLGSDSGSLIRSGDKQVYIQPPHKSTSPYPLPKLDPTKDFLEHCGTKYKIVTMKQYNPSMTNIGCVLYELYVRE